MVCVVNPQGIASPGDIGEQSLGICYNATDTATVARYNHRHRLACHLRTIIEKVCLHDSRHLAPPERGHDDDVLVVAETDVHRVDSRIAARIVRICLDGIQQLRTDSVVVCLILQSLLSRFYAHHVGLDLAGQCCHNLMALVGVAVIHDERLAHIRRSLCGLGLHVALRRTAGQQHRCQ